MQEGAGGVLVTTENDVRGQHRHQEEVCLKVQNLGLSLGPWTRIIIRTSPEGTCVHRVGLWASGEMGTLATDLGSGSGVFLYHYP